MERIPVMPMFHPDSRDGTTLWGSEDVGLWLRGLADSEQRRRCMRILQRLCDSNFRMYMPNMVKLEFGKTYGLHIDQFRVAGFFDQGYENFIALRWFAKKKQRNDRRMAAIYQKVDTIREAKLWIKIN